MIPVNEIICGDALTVMKEWPGESVNCCISSPPYWALRDYGVDGQLGLEPTFEEYIDKLCTIYDEVKRVLRKDGTCWVNLGDTYWGGKGQSGRCDHNLEQRVAEGRSFQRREYTLDTKKCPQDGIHEFVQAKSLCLIPQRFAIEMVNRGWILRNVIIWHKPNPMPSSAKDRFTVDFEYVYFFVKSKKYWFEPQYEPYQEASVGRYALADQRNAESFSGARDFEGGGRDANENPPRIYKAGQGTVKSRGDNVDHLCVGGSNPLGRNKRCVWTIPTQPYPESHFATFPEKLVEPMIKAGCPEFICTKCGKAREKIWDTKYVNQQNTDNVKYSPLKSQFGTKPAFGGGEVSHHFKGYTDCGCGADWRPGVMLDPFVVRARLVRSLPN